MIIFTAKNVARFFGSDVLFQNVSMDIQENSRIALVGRNGAGKSTLLKILCEIEASDEGEISKKKGINIGYLAQNTGLESTETVYQEMLKSFEPLIRMEERMRELESLIANGNSTDMDSTLAEYEQLQHDFQANNGYGYDSEIRSVLAGFQFDETYYDRKIAELSGGQKTRLALAKQLLESPDLLILDEPTNHLDIETLSWLEKYLQGYQGALLIVSHDRYFLDKVTTVTLELSRKKLKKYQGNYSKYFNLKAQEIASEMKQYEKQKAEISKLEDFVNRNLVRASTTKRAQSRRKTLEKMERMDKPVGDEKSAHFSFTQESLSGNVVLTVEDASVGYGEDILTSHLSLDVRRGDSIALVGPNGVGKSTFLKSVIGKLPLIEGDIRLGANVSIGYYDQEQAELSGNKTVLKELWDEHPTTPEKEIRQVLGAFLFTQNDVDKTIPLLSGGEKARVALAKLSMQHDNFLILDEPTNHLDIDNKEVLENALIDYEGTLLFVSHDRYFINRLATKVLELSEQKATLYVGDYDYYLQKKEEERLIREERSKAESTEKTLSIGKMNYQLSKEDQKVKRKLEREVDSLEKEMTRTENALSDIHEAMEEASVLNDFEKLAELTQRQEDVQANYDALLDEWETKSLELEEM